MWHVGPGTTGPRDEQAIIMSGVAIDQKLMRVSRESNAVCRGAAATSQVRAPTSVVRAVSGAVCAAVQNNVTSPNHSLQQQTLSSQVCAPTMANRVDPTFGACGAAARLASVLA